MSLSSRGWERVCHTTTSLLVQVRPGPRSLRACRKSCYLGPPGGSWRGLSYRRHATRDPERESLSVVFGRTVPLAWTVSPPHGHTSAATVPPRPWRGGRSAINAQIAIRGLPEDFDRWAALGCTGWSSVEVLPAFIRLEDEVDFGEAPYHGRGGPIPISRAPVEQWGAVEQAFRTAALDLGYAWSDDHNAPQSTGVSPWAMHRRADARVSTNDAYLEPARHRPNLTIRGHVLADRVMFEGKRAVGVRVQTTAG